MDEFYIGLHHPSDAWPFARSMISAIAIRKRKSGFRVNDWILDSGAFSQISQHGKFIISSDEYLELITKFSQCGILRAAVCQDWMCEPFILEKTGLDMKEHQWRTVQSYNELQQWSDLPIMPVLQGFAPDDYLEHLKFYGDRIEDKAWVGVGSVCKRNGNPNAIEDILLGIKLERPDLRLHGFGLKITALERDTVRALLYSSDSMAWSYQDRINGGTGSDPREALRYAVNIESIIKQPAFIQEQLSQWWR